MKERCILARVENLPGITALLNELGVEDCNPILVTAEEIFVNIASYACEDAGLVTLRAGMENDCFIMEFSDEGIHYNPLLAPTPDVDAPAQGRAPGGLGIFFAKQLMDSIKYKRQGNKNVLWMAIKLT